MHMIDGQMIWLHMRRASIFDTYQYENLVLGWIDKWLTVFIPLSKKRYHTPSKINDFILRRKSIKSKSYNLKIIIIITTKTKRTITVTTTTTIMITIMVSVTVTMMIII